MSKFLMFVLAVLFVGCSTVQVETDKDAGGAGGARLGAQDGSSSANVNATAVFATNTNYSVSNSVESRSQVMWGRYCCDYTWIRRCVLESSYVVGEPCFCYGQGAGWVCR